MTKDLDKKVARAMELHYERGFIDGMQKQMQSSVDKAVNRMAQTQEPKIGCVNHDCDKCKAQKACVYCGQLVAKENI